MTASIVLERSVTQAINRAELFAEMERLDAKASFLRRHQLANAYLRGGASQERKLEARIEAIEAASARIFGQLFQPMTNDEYEALGDNPKVYCDYCDYRFDLVGPHARFQAGGICPRCDPSSPGVNPHDPNWHPDKDRR